MDNLANPCSSTTDNALHTYHSLEDTFAHPKLAGVTGFPQSGFEDCLGQQPLSHLIKEKKLVAHNSPKV